MRNDARLSGVYVLTCEQPELGRTHVDVARAAIAGGAAVVQYRDKSGDKARLLETAAEIREMCSTAGVTFIVNDHLDAALEVGADGLHLGQDEVHLADEWRSASSGLLGVTAWTPELAERAVALGADYVGCGPFNPTSTKSVSRDPIGAAGVRVVRAAVGQRAAVAAIGGIGVRDVAAVRAAGADMVCVVSAIGAAEDPQAATEELVRAFASSGGS